MEGGESAGYANLDDLLDDVAIVVAHITGIHLHVEFVVSSTSRVRLGSCSEP
jgi:hypothetical protein